jgi:outer membrane murein-binding lipoprotein Lpp
MDLQWIAERLIALSESVAKLAGSAETQNLRVDTIEDKVDQLIDRLDAKETKLQNDAEQDARDKQTARFSFTQNFAIAMIGLIGAVIGGFASAWFSAHIGTQAPVPITVLHHH